MALKYFILIILSSTVVSIFAQHQEQRCLSAGDCLNISQICAVDTQLCIPSSCSSDLQCMTSDETKFCSGFQCVMRGVEGKRCNKSSENSCMPGLSCLNSKCRPDLTSTPIATVAQVASQTAVLQAASQTAVLQVASPNPVLQVASPTPVLQVAADRPIVSKDAGTVEQQDSSTSKTEIGLIIASVGAVILLAGIAILSRVRRSSLKNKTETELEPAADITHVSKEEEAAESVIAPRSTSIQKTPINSPPLGPAVSSGYPNVAYVDQEGFTVDPNSGHRIEPGPAYRSQSPFQQQPPFATQAPMYRAASPFNPQYHHEMSNQHPASRAAQSVYYEPVQPIPIQYTAQTAHSAYYEPAAPIQVQYTSGYSVATHTPSQPPPTSLANPSVFYEPAAPIQVQYTSGYPAGSQAPSRLHPTSQAVQSMYYDPAAPVQVQYTSGFPATQSHAPVSSVYYEPNSQVRRNDFTCPQ